MTAHTPDDNPPVPLTETECWAEVAKAAIDRGLMLEICHDPAHPENPWLRVVPR